MSTSLELARKSETDAGQRYRNDTEKHELTILHDDGLYRHLRFRQPTTNTYWFDLITWPGCLTIRGDLGDSYTFARLPDMFEFFRNRRINPHYWSEKLDRGRRSAKEYSEDLFRRLVVEHFVDVARDSGVPAGLGKAIRAEILDQDLTVESEARELLEAFEYGESHKATCACGARELFSDKLDADLWLMRHRCAHRPTVEHTPGFRFHDVWEWSFSDYEWQFLWACHAIVDGIRRYDAAKAEQAASRIPRAAVRNLVAAVEEAAAAGPCWVLRSTGRAALIGPDGQGGHRFVAGFHRRTLTEALALGLVQLGDTRGPVPQYSGGGKVWEWDGGALEGRTIALSHVDVATGGAS